MPKKISMFNGNGKRYIRDLPELMILTTKNINEIVLNHIKKQTGISFKKSWVGYSGTPKSFYQITKLFLTYNFRTQYHDNLSTKNTILLKFCSDEVFKVTSLCYECVEKNGINMLMLEKTDRLGV